MNRRERFIETMTFGSPDRPACGDYFAYDTTRQRWEREGLPPNADLNEYFGMDFDPFRWSLTGHATFLPNLPPEVLEETADYRIVRQKLGEVVKILKNVPPPAMPQWISYPLSSRADWNTFKQQLHTDGPNLLRGDLDALATQSPQRDYPLGLWLGSTYGYIRDLFGVEGASYLFYDDAALVEEMIETFTHLSVQLLDRALQTGIQLDWVMFWEDLAYKNGPLLSPELYKRWCMPFYQTVMEKVQAADIPVVMLDSDGDIREMIPLWLDCGITVMHPMEVASGMDVRDERRKHGRRIAFFGGIDKRALAGSRDDIDREVVPKLEACLADGGWIPACDHGIPPDVPFDNYRYYRELVDRYSRR